MDFMKLKEKINPFAFTDFKDTLLVQCLRLGLTQNLAFQFTSTEWRSRVRSVRQKVQNSKTLEDTLKVSSD